MKINPDINIQELVNSWINGNRIHVLDILENEHPALTAMMLVVGSYDRTLNVNECNTITNMLSDRRLVMIQKEGL